MLLQLPTDVLVEILQHLNVTSLAAVAQTCSRLNALPWPIVDLDSISGARLEPEELEYIILKRRPRLLRIKGFVGCAKARLLTPQLELIASDSVLTHLRLHGVYIGDQGIQAITPVVPQLVSLELAYNNVSPAGAQTLAKALKLNDTLEHLDLSSNSVQAAGAASIAAALTEASCRATLRYMDMSSNEVGGDACDALNQAFASLASLNHVAFSNNPIGDAGFARLAPGLLAAPRNLVLFNQCFIADEGTLLTCVRVMCWSVLKCHESRVLAERPATPSRTCAASLVTQLTLAECAFPTCHTIHTRTYMSCIAGMKALCSAPHTNEPIDTLNLSKNRITAAGLAALPTSSLVINFLDLSSNPLQQGRARVAPGSMEGVMLLQGVKRVDLSGCGLEDDGFECMCNALCSPHCTVEELDISNNQVTCTMLSMPHMAPSTFSGMHALQKLTLNFTPLSDSGVRLLCERVLHSPKLVELRLADTEFGADGALAVRDFLRKTKTLTHLDISGNMLGPKGAFAIGEGLALNSSLYKCYMSNCHLLRHVVEQFAQGFLTTETRNSTLHTLALSGNPMGASGGNAIGSMLAHNKLGVSTLSLAGGSLGDAGLEGFVEGVRTNTTLKCLNLKGNRITPESLGKLGDLLEHTQSRITCLDLSRNLLTGDGLVVFLRHITALKRHMQRLVLSDNQINEVNVHTVAHFLRQNPNLAHLSLSGNKLGSKGLRILSPALQDVKHLRQLELLQVVSHGARDAADAFRALIKENRHVLVLRELNALQFDCSQL
eukprot:m.57145 g.57145  ORF g.57145 m.57145 type:complete len:776 (-) comp11588_c0_seq3:5344-7671(-)